jgi:hypothetical protein
MARALQLLPNMFDAARGSRRFYSVGSALVTGVILGVSSRSAGAEAATEPPSTANREQSRSSAGSLSVGVLAGWNHGDEVGAGGPRTLFGYGGRLGYSFATTPLYLGFTVVNYTDDIRHDDNPESGGVTYGTEHHVHTTIDIGAELAAGPFILRPYLGVGARLGIWDGEGNGNSGIAPELVPGIHIRYPIAPIFIGADARWELGWGKSAALLGSVGASF